MYRPLFSINLTGFFLSVYVVGPTQISSQNLFMSCPVHVLLAFVLLMCLTTTAFFLLNMSVGVPFFQSAYYDIGTLHIIFRGSFTIYTEFISRANFIEKLSEWQNDRQDKTICRPILDRFYKEKELRMIFF